MFTIYYSKQKAKKQKNDEQELLQEARRLQKTSGNRTKPELIKVYDSIKNKPEKNYRSIAPVVHVYTQKLDGTNLENGVLNISSIWRRETMKINASPF